MIPEAKNAAVSRALREAFGVGEFEEIRMLTEGMSSALVFRIAVRGRPYLLRIITKTDALNDPTRQFACMRAAAEAGLAPRIWYASTEDRISITDFVPVRPLAAGKSGVAELGSTVRRVHALPPFPKLVNYLESMDGYVRKFQAAKILPENETDEVCRFYERVSSVYPRHDADLVSSHNDMKPENILFDGERVWLVDWEAAFLNDRYLDLAVVANFFVRNEAEEEVFLRAYFGQRVDEYRRARFYLMRQVVHMGYAAVFLLIGSSGKPIAPGGPPPGFRGFHDQILAGNRNLVSAEAKIDYARIHMQQALVEMRAKQFEEALRVVSGHPARA
ncbi:MAG: phosphotransferase [Candidatus Acidiferrales bacterium]